MLMLIYITAFQTQNKLMEFSEMTETLAFFLTSIFLTHFCITQGVASALDHT